MTVRQWYRVYMAQGRVLLAAQQRSEPGGSGEVDYNENMDKRLKLSNPLKTSCSQFESACGERVAEVGEEDQTCILASAAISR